MPSETAPSPCAADDAALLQDVRQALNDPTTDADTLRTLLVALLGQNEEQQVRLERLVRISDGYHLFSREQSLTLTEQYDRQLRRLEKLARISDRYQNSLRELSEALKEAALQDALTGLGNRRYLMDRLREETERATRRNTGYALCILDVDHFKAINDRFGHETGDQALLLIARSIKNSLRSYDLCGRWGGEEFLILLPEATLAEALPILERVRHDIAATPLQLPGHDEEVVTVTASLGVAGYLGGERFSDTLNRADRGLREAKRCGRDRVVVVGD